MKIFTSFGSLSLSGLSYNGIRAISQVYSGRIGTFFSRKEKKKDKVCILEVSGTILIEYMNMSKNGISMHPRSY